MKRQLLLTVIASILLFGNIYSQIPTYVPTNSLVGWWPFTGNTNDLSGNGNNLTNSSAVLTTDRYSNLNSAYSFTGLGGNGVTGAFMTIPNFSINTLSAFSINIWVYEASVLGDGEAYISFGDTYPGGCIEIFRDGYSLPSGAGILRFNYGNSLSNSISAGTGFQNQWIMCTMVKSNNQLKAYINGSVIGTINSLNPASITNSGNYLARHTWGITSTATSTRFNGKLDDLGIWSRALTDCEITQLYNASVYATPTITTIGSTTLCSGKTATLSANATGSYTWSTGATTQSITVSTAGSYSVVVSNGTCTGNAPPILISVTPLPTISVTNATICSGQSFTITPSGASTYTIQGGSAIKTPTATSVYTVIGTSSLGCVSQTAATSSVTVNQSPTIAVDNLTICAGQTATLNASGATTYTWNTNANTSSIVVSPINTSNYTVSGTSNSCTSTQTVKLLVSACTRINELKAEQHLNITPNPNSGEFVITAETFMQINITDYLGRLVKTIEVKPGKNAYQLNDLSIGVYLLSGESYPKIYKGRMVIN